MPDHRPRFDRVIEEIAIFVGWMVIVTVAILLLFGFPPPKPSLKNCTDECQGDWECVESCLRVWKD